MRTPATRSRTGGTPMRSYYTFFASILGVAAGAPAIAAPSAPSWTPPHGIPAPSFGIHEAPPPRPSPWTAAVPGFYYVDQGHAAATDDDNPYGWPDKPRQTLPRPIPAGALVEIHGQYATDHGSPHQVVCAGTATHPAFVVGADDTIV